MTWDWAAGDNVSPDARGGRRGEPGGRAAVAGVLRRWPLYRRRVIVCAGQRRGGPGAGCYGWRPDSASRGACAARPAASRGLGRPSRRRRRRRRQGRRPCRRRAAGRRVAPPPDAAHGLRRAHPRLTLADRLQASYRSVPGMESVEMRGTMSPARVPMARSGSGKCDCEMPEPSPISDGPTTHTR
jgi:hypothetical protein